MYKQNTFGGFLFSVLGAGVLAISLSGCANEKLETASSEKNNSLSFEVSKVEDYAKARASVADKVIPGRVTPGIAAKDLKQEIFPLQTSVPMGDMVLESNTVEGIDVQKGGASAKAVSRGMITDDVKTSNIDFAVVGYRYAAPNTQRSNDNLWFKDEKTHSDGKMYNTYYWNLEKPYGQFFGVHPYTAVKDKINIPATTGEIPTINFTVSSDAKQQVDLLSAYTGETGKCSGRTSYHQYEVFPCAYSH